MVASRRARLLLGGAEAPRTGHGPGHSRCADPRLAAGRVGVTEGTRGGIVRQRCVLVLPSTGEFDSRAYRIASTVAARGHDVTMLARWAPGLPTDERHPSGYRILRVPVSAVDGLPRPIRGVVQRLRPRRGGGGPSRTLDPTGEAGRSAGPGRVPGLARVRRFVGSVRRLAAIGLTVRSQGGRTEAVAPPSDLVHAMAYMGIPIGLALGRRDGAAVIYDARDIYVDAANLARLPRPARALFARFERRWARQASRVVTVNEPYAGVMAERFEVAMPLIVLNCSYRQTDYGRPRRFHEALGLDDAAQVVLYHGGLSRDRGIEQLITALPALPASTHLVLMGYGVLQAGVTAQSTEPEMGDRLHVLPAVPPTELLEWVGSADVVAMPIQPSTLNHRLTTPNKLFEAMAAGVPVVASDLPGMAGIVRQTGCGLLVDPIDPAAIARAVSTILELPPADREAMGRRGRHAHLATYNWEAQAEVLLAEYGRLTGRPW
jgi:glycosyltransferase involved in cell wall biosynthesis